MTNLLQKNFCSYSNEILNLRFQINDAPFILEVERCTTCVLGLSAVPWAKQVEDIYHNLERNLSLLLFMRFIVRISQGNARSGEYSFG